jgi:hypothetical protein
VLPFEGLELAAEAALPPPPPPPLHPDMANTTFSASATVSTFLMEDSLVETVYGARNKILIDSGYPGGGRITTGFAVDNRALVRVFPIFEKAFPV